MLGHAQHQGSSYLVEWPTLGQGRPHGNDSLCRATDVGPFPALLPGRIGFRAFLEVVNVSTELKALILKDNGLDNDTVVAMCRVLSKHPTLAVLDVSSNPISLAAGQVLYRAGVVGAEAQGLCEARHGPHVGMGGAVACRAKFPPPYFPQFSHPKLSMTVIHPWGALDGASIRPLLFEKLKHVSSARYRAQHAAHGRRCVICASGSWAGGGSNVWGG